MKNPSLNSTTQNKQQDLNLVIQFIQDILTRNAHKDLFELGKKLVSFFDDKKEKSLSVDNKQAPTLTIQVKALKDLLLDNIRIENNTAAYISRDRLKNDDENPSFLEKRLPDELLLTAEAIAEKIVESFIKKDSDKPVFLLKPYPVRSEIIKTLLADQRLFATVVKKLFVSKEEDADIDCVVEAFFQIVHSTLDLEGTFHYSSDKKEKIEQICSVSLQSTEKLVAFIKNIFASKEIKDQLKWRIVKSAFENGRGLSSNGYTRILSELVKLDCKDVNLNKEKFYFIIDKILPNIKYSELSYNKPDLRLEEMKVFFNSYPPKEFLELLLSKPTESDLEEFFYFKTLMNFCEKNKTIKQIFKRWIGQTHNTKSSEEQGPLESIFMLVLQNDKLKETEEHHFFSNYLKQSIISSKLNSFRLKSKKEMEVFLEHYSPLRSREFKKFINSLDVDKIQIFLKFFVIRPLKQKKKDEDLILTNQPISFKSLTQFSQALNDLILCNKLAERGQPTSKDFLDQVKNQIIAAITPNSAPNKDEAIDRSLNTKLYKNITLNTHALFAFERFLKYGEEDEITKQAISQLTQRHDLTFDLVHKAFVKFVKSDSFFEKHQLKDFISFYIALINASENSIALLAELFNAEIIDDDSTLRIMQPFLEEANVFFLENFLKKQYEAHFDRGEYKIDPKELKEKHTQIINNPYDSDDSIFDGYGLRPAKSTPRGDENNTLVNGDNSEHSIDSYSQYKSVEEENSDHSFFSSIKKMGSAAISLCCNDNKNDKENSNLSDEQQLNDKEKVITRKEFFVIFRKKLLRQQLCEYKEINKLKNESLSFYRTEPTLEDFFNEIITNSEFNDHAKLEMMNLFFLEEQPPVEFFWDEEVYGVFFERGTFWNDGEELLYPELIENFFKHFWLTVERDKLSLVNLNIDKQSHFSILLGQYSKMENLIISLKKLLNTEQNLTEIQKAKKSIDFLVPPWLKKKNEFDKIRKFFFEKRLDDPLVANEIYCHFIITKLKHDWTARPYTYLYFEGCHRVNYAIKIAESLKELQYLFAYTPSLKNLNIDVLTKIHINLKAIIARYDELYAELYTESISSDFKLATLFKYNASIKSSFLYKPSVNDDGMNYNKFIEEYIENKLADLKPFLHALELKIQYKGNWFLDNYQKHPTQLWLRSMWLSLCDKIARLFCSIKDYFWGCSKTKETNLIENESNFLISDVHRKVLLDNNSSSVSSKSNISSQSKIKSKKEDVEIILSNGGPSPSLLTKV